MASHNEDPKQKIEALRDQLHDYNYKYHVLDDPQIPDADYDVLLQELLSLEQEYPAYQSEDSPRCASVVSLSLDSRKFATKSRCSA